MSDDGHSTDSSASAEQRSDLSNGSSICSWCSGPGKNPTDITGWYDADSIHSSSSQEDQSESNRSSIRASVQEDHSEVPSPETPASRLDDQADPVRDEETSSSAGVEDAVDGDPAQSMDKDEEENLVDEDLDSVLVKSSDERDGEVVTKIEALILDFLRQLNSDPPKRISISLKGRPKIVFPSSRRGIESIDKLAQLWKLLALIRGAISDNQVFTIREVFESGAELFESQAAVDSLVNDLAVAFEVTCEELHIVGSVKSLFPVSSRLSIQKLQDILSAHKVPFNESDRRTVLVPLYEALKNSKINATMTDKKPTNDGNSGGNSAASSQTDGMYDPPGSSHQEVFRPPIGNPGEERAPTPRPEPAPHSLNPRISSENLSNYPEFNFLNIFDSV
ncbi:endodeoxyribonuclease [Puccinia graminis f. sp. tritici]|uniref:Endodeoxyribonuclease n=1 Tax=Puccinia graminis f. sp. tritici TaxID=56615 RepID=A0A5B0N9D4_PUCGR|nr:endodeoxyribonuclease [Puccinia graminis f. sp. tritici]KAA1092233.1 endodeoxyribonuclease [Puccinia graminis f. sp. tritici]